MTESRGLATAKNITASQELDTLIAPWTPIEISKNNSQLSIRCLGREYVFNRSIFPSQIISKGDPLLSGPIEIQMDCRNKNLRWEETSIEVINADDGAVDLEGSTIANGSCGRVEVKSKIHIEYDGLMLISLYTTASESEALGPFSISIPYKSMIAKYYTKWVKNKHNKYSGRISERTGGLIESEYSPYYWIGDNTKGLFWFCESTEYWPNANDEKAIQLVRTGNTVTQKFDIGASKEYRFGLQATPVKPFPEDWREWRLAPAHNSNIVIRWGNPGKENSIKYHSWPEATNSGNYKQIIEEQHSQGKKVIAYGAISRISSLSPIYQRNKSTWTTGSVEMKLKNGGNLVYIEPGSQGYIDTIVRNFTHYLTEYDLDGYYLDGGRLYSNWKGKNKPNYFPILKYRELQRKLYRSIKMANPNAIIITHMSGDMNIPVLTYTDAYLDGEQFRYMENGKLAYKAEESYLDALTLDQFRAEFMGKQWGIIPFFLPEVSLKNRENLQPTQGLATLLLLHDVPPWATNSNLSVWNKMYQQLDRFQYQNSQFIPYYDPKPPGTTGLDAVHVSAYTKGDQALVIVGNLSKRDEDVIVALDPSVLGMSQINSVLSLSEQNEINIDDNRVSIPVKAMSYQMLWLK